LYFPVLFDFKGTQSLTTEFSFIKSVSSCRFHI